MKILFSFVAGCCICLGGFSQDLNFSQIYKQPLLRNPALCGLYSGSVRVQSVYRNQWQKITVPYRTTAFSVESKVPFCLDDNNLNYWAIGAQVTYDVAGDSRLTRFQFLPAVSYHKNLNGQEGAYLIAALMPGWTNSHFDPTGLHWDDQYQGNGTVSPQSGQVITDKNRNINYLDLGAGLVLTSPFGNGNSFYVGAAVYHVNRPSTTFNSIHKDINKLNPRWMLNGALDLSVDDDNSFQFFGDFIHQGDSTLKTTGKISTWMIGGLYSLNIGHYDPNDPDKITIGFGAMYRRGDAVAPLIDFDYHRWSAGVSYDINISTLKTASQSMGGMELTLGYLLSNCSKLPCPKF